MYKEFIKDTFIDKEKINNIFINFVKNTFILTIKKSKGFIEIDDEKVLKVVSFFEKRFYSFKENTKELKNGEEVQINDLSEEFESTVNSLAEFFKTPFNFLMCVDKLNKMSNFILEAFACDSEFETAPIATELINSEIFYNFYETGSFPDNVKKVLEYEKTIFNVKNNNNERVLN